MPRLPQPGGDSGTWGEILNEYLLHAHSNDGSLKPNSVTAGHIADGTLTEALFDTDTQNKLNTAGSGNVADGTITTLKLHDDAVTTIKLADDSVANAKLQDGAVTSAKIQDGTIVNADISSSADIAQTKIAGLATSFSAKADLVHTHAVAQLSDSTPTGRSLLTAADAATARSVIGAGTSNLTVGVTSGTAKAGDYSPTWSEVSGKPTEFSPSDAGTASLVSDDNSDTRGALDALYVLPAELRTGSAPVASLHADAGAGAQIQSGGTRLALRVAVVTGVAPQSGGTLATFALTGYTLAPVVSVNPRDEVSAATFAYATSSVSTLTLKVAGELEPAVTYEYDLIILGL